MAAKRALVVDDSKSARAFLSRMLEKHLLEVDCAESAEEAIDYLTRHRPDVIFMDHLMPGMDGFQAVQAIKNNPRTATIPILMYTSQEGELYLGQARALGAIGVLPKQIRPADVTQVLLQLHLFEERRERARPDAIDAGPDDPTQIAAAVTGVGTLSTPVLPPELQQSAVAGVADAPAAAAAASASTSATGRYAFGSAVDQLLRDQIAELRRTLVSRLDDIQDGLPSQLHAAVRAELPPAAPPAPPPETQVDRRGWLVAAGLGVLALIFAAQWTGERRERVALDRTLVALVESSRVAAPDAPGPAAAAAAAADAPSRAVAPAARPRVPASPLSIAVPFGEQPLSGERIGTVRSALEELRRAGFRGDVDLQVFQGRFCLVGNASEGFSLAPEELAYSRCDRVGNVGQDGGASRESTAFANMLAEQRKAAGSAVGIRIADGADRPAQPYPDAAPNLTAGPWNAIAAANNRIEMRWRERP
jgi:CheY-like chemotaxis protein